MLTLELSVLVLEIPNDAYTTLSQNLIGCSTLRQGYQQADWLIVPNNEKATSNINMPYCHHTFVAAEDAALQPELRYLYEWLFEKCEGKAACDAVDNIVPEWWYHVSDDTECQTNTTVGLKYFNGILVARRCKGMLRYPLQII